MELVGIESIAVFVIFYLAILAMLGVLFIINELVKFVLGIEE